MLVLFEQVETPHPYLLLVDKNYDPFRYSYHVVNNITIQVIYCCDYKKNVFNKDSFRKRGVFTITTVD